MVTVRGYYFQLGEKYHYYFPGRIAFAFREKFFLLEALTNPSPLENLVIEIDKAKKEEIKKDPNTRKIRVPLSLVEMLKRAIKENDYVRFLHTLWKIEKYQNES